MLDRLGTYHYQLPAHIMQSVRTVSLVENVGYKEKLKKLRSSRLVPRGGRPGRATLNLKTWWKWIYLGPISIFEISDLRLGGWGRGLSARVRWSYSQYVRLT